MDGSVSHFQSCFDDLYRGACASFNKADAKRCGFKYRSYIDHLFSSVKIQNVAHEKSIATMYIKIGSSYLYIMRQFGIGEVR
jgi:hypothetical protein